MSLAPHADRGRDRGEVQGECAERGQHHVDHADPPDASARSGPRSPTMRIAITPGTFCEAIVTRNNGNAMPTTRRKRKRRCDEDRFALVASDSPSMRSNAR